MALLEIKNFNVTYKMKEKEVYAVQDAGRGALQGSLERDRRRIPEIHERPEPGP